MEPNAVVTPQAAPHAWPREEPLFEVVAGQQVELPPMGSREVWIASALAGEMAPLIKSKALGRVVVEMLFRLQPPGAPQRRPDVAFVSYERWPRDRPLPPGNAWDVVPDLAVEVISESNLANEIPGRVGEYFRAGVRRVWVVFPEFGLVYDYADPKGITVLDRADALDGGDILPGFRLALKGLFADVLPGE